MPIGGVASGRVCTRDGTTYMLASNACVNLYIVWVKSVTNSMLCCRKSELCCAFALFGVILMAFNLVIFYFTLIRGKTFIYDIIVASIIVWRSHFAHTF